MDEKSTINDVAFHAELFKQLAEQGRDTTKITENGEFLFIEGDIALNKEPLRQAYERFHSNNNSGSLKKTSQRGIGYEDCSGWWLWETCINYGPIDQNHVALITVRLDIPGLQNQLNDALKNWNSSGSSLYFRQVSGGADIVISETSEPSMNGSTNYLAWGEYAHNGHTGTRILIRNNTGSANDWPNRSYTNNVRTLTHELGHTVGLGHTNVDDGGSYHIDRTPNKNDPNSIMNSYSISPYQLTDWDKVAVRMLYPLPRDPDLTFMGDVNGDGRKDLIIIANSGVNVALANSNGQTFGALTLWIHEFAQDGGWQKGFHPRTVADINGDGKVDVIGFGNGGVTVAISTGNGFISQMWSNDFSYNLGWRVESHPRLLADVNGDGRADVVGFANDVTVVGLSTGNSFTSSTWTSEFSYNLGWRVGSHPRLLADVNGDGRADVVGFANGGTVVGLSTGSSFTSSTWTSDFSHNLGWRVGNHPRLLADVNGDGRADVVGFANGGTIVGLSTGNSFASSTWTSDFSYNSGWRVESHPRLLADVNGDGKADVIGFANGGTIVGLSTGSSFNSSMWIADYCYNIGWRVNDHPRMMVDLNNDGKSDVCALGYNEFLIGQSTGSQFNSILAYQYK